MNDSLPHEIVMATGSYNLSGWTFALVVFVNEKNPIAQLTLEQLDGIFGAQREGGWDFNSWDPSAARGAEKNIRTWGQLGLTGEWADKPINVYGYTLNYHFPRDFAEKVFNGRPGFDKARVKQVIDQGQQAHYGFPEPVTLYVTYRTVGVASDGSAVFRDDVYGRDKRVVAAMAKPRS